MKAPSWRSASWSRRTATAVYILESAILKGLPFNSVWSVGNARQIGVEDVLEYMDAHFDPATDSHIKLLYIESIRNPDSLLAHAASLIRKGCRIAAIKAGSSESGSRAASSHTGAIASSDSAVEALFRKAGIVRCHSREELTTVGCIFTLPPLRGRNIAIVTHAGGPGVMLTDALSKGGLRVPPLCGKDADELKAQLFPGASVGNPIDILATGTPEHLGLAIDYCEERFEGIDAENKINNLSYLTIVRNGDCIEERPETTLSYYIKGANITGWGNMFNNATQLAPNADESAYTLEIYLREGEEFMFHTWATNVADGTSSDANIYINYNNLDTTSAALFSHPENGTNILATKSGTYTFTYVPGADNAAGTLSATLDETKGLTIGDYYINGTIANDTPSWGTSSVTEADGMTLMDAYKLTVDPDNADLYLIEGVTFRVDDEFTVAAFTAGSTTTGDGWSNQIASYNSTYLAPTTTGFEAASAQNLNAKCTEAGVYDISFNVYSRIVTITPAVTA